MRRAFEVAALAALVVVAAIAAGGCSSEQHDLSVAEGTPVTLGNVEYNVQVSRFLNPSDDEDKAYLDGAPTLAPDDYYLGVFLTVDNTGYEKSSLPTRYEVTDTEHDTYAPVTIDNEFALPLGGEVPAREQIPNADSIPANAPIGGLMLLFVIHESSTENRPLTLKIPAAGNAAPGRIELDI
jgi:hypothetical protein